MGQRPRAWCLCGAALGHCKSSKAAWGRIFLTPNVTVLLSIIISISLLFRDMLSSSVRSYLLCL